MQAVTACAADVPLKGEINVQEDRMLIDFAKIEKLIPEKGSLVFRIRKTDKGMLQVSCAPVFAGKKVSNHPAKGEEQNVALAVSPVTYEDTVANFNAQYEQTITEILGQKTALLDLAAQTNRTIAVSGAKKKEELRKAIEKKGGANKAGDNQGSKDRSLSLFSSGGKKGDEKVEASATEKDRKEEGQGQSCAAGENDGGVEDMAQEEDAGNPGAEESEEATADVVA
jgi:hypothetical protein